MTRSVIATLRDFVPLRPLTDVEALSLAERQALRFHAAFGSDMPPLAEELIAGIPRVQIERMSPIPVSGSTHWATGRWLIVLNGAEPAVRQRFSLAHELKHILDHPFVDILYRAIPSADRGRRIEQLCDYFAGCLLAPRPWVKRIYCSGIQYLPELAARFGMSQAAMQVRLNQIGLVPPQDRCSRQRPDWHLRAWSRAGTPALYERTASLAVT